MPEQITDIITSPSGARLLKRWNPKDWKPVYEAMVALCATGKSQGEVAKEFGYTEAWLSQIMNSERGRIVKAQIISAMRHEVSASVGERVRDIQEKALQRMEAVINDDVIAKRSPLAIFDRSALFLKNTGIIKDKGQAALPTGANTTTNITQNTLIINGQEAKSLKEGLKRADEVKLLHSGV